MTCIDALCCWDGFEVPAQSIAAAVNQGSVSVDLAGLDEGWKLDVLARPDVDTTQRILVQAPNID
ncbi:MAG: hypothetical protein ACRDTA_20730 [Pseudonocardiaceae bacterium]